MVGIGFTAFVTLVVLGFIASFALHVLLRYQILPRWDGFALAWVVGWFGAWLGTPVFGHWGVHMGGLFFVPALLGAFAGPFVTVAGLRALSLIAQPARPATGLPQASATSHVEMKRAS